MKYEVQYRFIEYKQYKKDTVYYVQKRYFYKNKLFNFMFGTDWFSVSDTGYRADESLLFKTFDKQDAKQFIEWLKINLY